MNNNNSNNTDGGGGEVGTTTTTSTTGGGGVLESVRYQPINTTTANPPILVPTLSVLDQLLLPHEKIYISISDVTSTWNVIKKMQVRGAPLIAIVACLGLIMDLQTNIPTITELDTIVSTAEAATTNTSSAVVEVAQTIMDYIQKKMNYLITSRPTAVNLYNAMMELQQRLQVEIKHLSSSSSTESSSTTTSPSTIRHQLIQVVSEYATFMLQRDIQDNQQIGTYGAEYILEQYHQKHHHGEETKNTNNTTKLTMMTICNTGSLATAGYGTALGIIRSLQSQNALQQIIALETRPYNQGSRLTAFEIVQDHMPNGTLICDSMAAAMMYMRQQSKQQQNEKGGGEEEKEFAGAPIDGIVVGADRVCANGDTINKIGTYSLALCAKAHNIPFYVAAPTTTLDITLDHGNQVPIEERPKDELIISSQAPKDIHVWNPSFDITPAYLISGIITERGVIIPNKNNNDGHTLDVKGFVMNHKQQQENESSSLTTTTTTTTVSINHTNNDTYQEQSIQTLPLFLLQNVPVVFEQVLQATTLDDIQCTEVGDGNLNLVFIVTNINTSQQQQQASSSLLPPQIIVKQALPYVRCVGESWPLTLERSFFEYQALTTLKKACPEFVPMVYYFSKLHGLMIMQYLPPPNIILRKGLIQGIRYPTMAIDMASYCAKTLFKTSGFQLSTTELRQQVEFWSTNREMCALTEQVVFTEPYMNAPNNRWNTPYLDQDKQAIEQDSTLKVVAARYKDKFVTETQSLIHADLHTGSVMCSPVPGQTFVIDPEFAFYGPMAFDTGAFVANLFLAYVAQDGHDNGETYADWILEQIETFWMSFVQEFIQLWNDPMEHRGYKYGRTVMESTPEAIQESQQLFLSTMLADTLGFAGMKMLRRIVGIAHVEDLESIQDLEIRARCERRGLEIAKVFIKNSASFASMKDAIQLAREKKGVAA